MFAHTRASAPWQTLVTALSLGSTGALYDPLATGAATVAAGDISALKDARGGSGFAPTLSTLVGTIAFNATTGAMTFTGSNALATAASSVFSLASSVSLFVIMSAAGAGAQIFHSLYGGNNCGLYLEGYSGDYWVGTDISGFVAGTSVAYDSNIRLIVVSATSGGNGNIDIQTRASAGGGTAAAGTPLLTLGGKNGSANNPSVVYAAGVIPRIVTAGDITALKAYAVTKGYTPA
jgi:hypothetical protein